MSQRVTGIQASRIVCDALRVRPKRRGMVFSVSRPTTAALLRVLHDPRFGKRIKGHVYHWLLYRQHQRQR